jgi:uncharacterized protein (DUF924 family)
MASALLCLLSRCALTTHIVTHSYSVLRRKTKAYEWFARDPVRDQSRQIARAFLDRWPAAAYMSEVETWRELPGGEIEFTMKRLRSAD